MQFQTHHVAIHLVDPRMPKPQLSAREVVIADADDKKTVDEFIDRHLTSIWHDDTASIADIGNESEVIQHWQAFRDNKITFIDASQKLAELLHNVSPPNATRGLLLATQFSEIGETKEYLALIKLDPGDRGVLHLTKEQEKILLDLAVEHIELALPDPKGVLKWALLPHPALPEVGAKFKDRQISDVESAVYFMTYLGATVRRRDNIAINAVMDAAGTYLQQEHPDRHVKAKLPDVAKGVTDHLAAGKTLTPTKIVQIVKDKTGVREVDPRKLKAALKQKQVAEVRLARPKAIPHQTVTYELDNKIRISGPSTAMENQVQVEEVNGEVVFTVKANKYTIKRGR